MEIGKFKRFFFCLIVIVLSTLDLAAQITRHFKKELIFSNPPFRQCHASSIVELQSGKLMVACFGGDFEGHKDVSIWITASTDSHWTKPAKIASGVINDTLSYPCWNPVLFQSATGKLFLFYKVGPSPQSWWGMVKTSSDEGNTWSAAVRLPQDILGPVKNKPLQLPEGTILSPSSVEKADKWSAHIEISTDDGQTWKKIAVDSSSRYNVIQPSIVRHDNGKLQVLCRSKEGKVMQSWSPDNGSTWSAFSETDLLNPNSGTDAVTLSSGLQLIIYNPTLPGKEWWEGRTVLSAAISTNGTHWKKIFDLENQKNGEFSYPAVIQSQNGDVHITYTYDRKNIRHVMVTRKELQY